MVRPIAKAGSLLLVVTALSAGFISAPSSAASVTTKKRPAKTTTRPKTTAKRTTSKPPTTKLTTTKLPTTKLTTATSRPASTTTPQATAPQTIAVVSANGGVAANSPVAFDRQRYAFTLGALTTSEVPFFLNVAPGFNETLQLRVPQLPTGVLVRFDPNPVRNFFSMTLRVELSALPASDFDIEVTASSNSSVVLARATVSLFVTGTTAVAGPIQPPNGDPQAPPGVILSVTPASVQVTRGSGAGTVKIDLTRQGNYSGPVTFAVTNALPVGVGVSFQANATSGNVNYLFVSAGSNAAASTFVLNLEVIAGAQRTPIPVTVVVL